MRKSSLRLASLMAMVAASAEAVSAAANHRPYRPSPRRPYRPWPPVVEQSTRQELRGQRRAQGGPGITLNPRTFEYEPRD